jgi:hypothetical protein
MIKSFWKENHNNYYLRLTHEITGITVEGNSPSQQKKELIAVLTNKLSYKVRRGDFSDQPEKLKKR